MKPFKIWCETEKEKRAVLKKMERMGIRWLSGHKPSSDDYCAPIALFVNMDGSLWKRNSKSDYDIYYSYQPKSVREFLGEQEKIVIFRDGRKVIALDKRTGEKAEARCNPSNPFDFNIGARIAFDRLIPNKEPASPEPKGFTGKAVFIGSKSSFNVDFTVGKIYEFTDGKVSDDNGDLRPRMRRKRFSNGSSQWGFLLVSEWGFLPIVE